MKFLLLATALTLGLAACSSESAETGPPVTESATTTAAPAPTSTNAPTTVAPTTVPPTTVAPSTTTTTTQPEPVIVSIDVTEGVVDGPGRIRLGLDTRTMIVVTSDVEDEAHLHGYDVFVDVGPATAGVIDFVADVPGIFELELEDARLLLAELEVS